MQTTSYVLLRATLFISGEGRGVFSSATVCVELRRFSPTKTQQKDGVIG